MYKSIFKITNLNEYPSWAKTEDGKEAPVRELWLKDITEDPVVDEVICNVYGIDAVKHYEYGECILATLDIFLGYNEDESRKQVIRVRGIKKLEISKDS